MEFTEYEKYLLSSELNKAIFFTKHARDKVGISPEDQESEPNRRIKALNDLLIKLNLEVYE
jgi:hypothetical protein